MTGSLHPGALVDALLGPRFERADTEVRRRGRLVASASLLLSSSAFLFVGLLLAFDWGRVFIPVTVGAGLLFAGNLWLLRRTGWLEVAGLTLCLLLLAAVATTSWLQGGLLNGVLVWSIVVCLFAPLLIGPRPALLCVGLVLVHLMTLYLAERWGHVFPALSPNHAGLVSNQILAMSFVGILAWTIERSRVTALAARDAAVALVEESREARAALVENVAAVVFSVDRDLGLIAGNSFFEKLSHRPGEPPMEPGRLVLDLVAEAQQADMRTLFARALAGEHFTVERRLEMHASSVECEMAFNPIYRAAGSIRGVTVLIRDVGERHRAGAELDRLNRQLTHAAHLAGKAEVAIDVLHNVGNVLTALNSGASLVAERLAASKVPYLGMAVALLPTSPTELAHFLSHDDKGRQIRQYFGELATNLDEERAELTTEVDAIIRHLDHLKTVIARQQAFAQAISVVEIVPLAELIAEAVQMGASSLERHGIALTTEVADLPPLTLDRHKLLEILTNFLANSRQSLDASPVDGRRIVVRAFRNGQDHLQIDVADTGVGIAPSDLERLFTYGFTTKSDGHGFGLAGSLLGARSMGGTIRAHSDGPGKGATFSVEVPLGTAAANPPAEHAA